MTGFTAKTEIKFRTVCKVTDINYINKQASQLQEKWPQLIIIMLCPRSPVARPLGRHVQ